MPVMDVRIVCGVAGAEPVRIERKVPVSQVELEQLIPPSPSGGSGGWAYWREAEVLVCSIVKEELFPDEVTPIETLEDLRGLGVNSLNYSFDHPERGSMGSPAIYPD